MAKYHSTSRVHLSCRTAGGAGILALALLCLVPVARAETERAAPWIGDTMSDVSCSSWGRTQGFGPYDYTNPRHAREHLRKVEPYHFTRKVMMLEGGESVHRVIGDIHYTLSAFPNHHRALFSLIRYHTEPGYYQRDFPNGTRRLMPPECWLQRAGRFSPRDPNVPFLYGLYLHRLERFEAAEKKYRTAIEMEPNNPEFHYNLGLLLTRMDRYEEARESARRAYELGFPLPGLRARLERAGYPL